MNNTRFTEEEITAFEKYLWEEEKRPLTVEKYVRDVRAFQTFLSDRPLEKAMVIAYKEHLIDAGYAPRSINSMLASVSSMLRFLGREDCRVKNIRLQKNIYCSEDEQLTREDYVKLVDAAGRDSQLGCILEAVCSTGIRISELQYFTVEAVKRGLVFVSCKNKTRIIMLPRKLQKILLRYAKRVHIRTGVIFRTKNGRPVNRSSIWAWMKKLSRKVQVLPTKVFPHNLRKLFARTFYQAERDIVKLADVLGHSSIETTRLYIMSTGNEHREKIEQLDLVL